MIINVAFIIINIFIINIFIIIIFIINIFFIIIFIINIFIIIIFIINIFIIIIFIPIVITNANNILIVMFHIHVSLLKDAYKKSIPFDMYFIISHVSE